MGGSESEVPSDTHTCSTQSTYHCTCCCLVCSDIYVTKAFLRKYIHVARNLKVGVGVCGGVYGVCVGGLCCVVDVCVVCVWMCVCVCMCVWGGCLHVCGGVVLWMCVSACVWVWVCVGVGVGVWVCGCVGVGVCGCVGGMCGCGCGCVGV